MNRKKKTPVSQNKDKVKGQVEIQKILQKIPHDELISSLATLIQNRSSGGAQRVVQTIKSRLISQQTFSGPIPDPKTLSEYAAAGPDIPDRIVIMAEVQQNHRQELEKSWQELEKSRQEAAIKTEKRGQNYALLISLVVIIGSAYLISIEKEIYGSILGGSTLIGLAYLFITGKKKNKE